MTATAEISEKSTTRTEPMRLADGGRMIVRGAQRLIGGALALAAIGLWFAPGSSLDSDVVLFKLVLSLGAVFAGLALLHASAMPRAPEVEIDTIRRQIRVVRRQRGAKPHVLQSCSFGQLSSAEFDGARVRMWDDNHVLLAEVELPDAAALRSLVAGLQDEGKLP
ncbi:MAG: hypothetical protein AAF943_11960 [Pseudomonadota bacterium]